MAFLSIFIGFHCRTMALPATCLHASKRGAPVLRAAVDKLFTAEAPMLFSASKGVLFACSLLYNCWF